MEFLAKWAGYALPPSVWLGVAGVFGSLAAYRWFKIKPQLDQLAQGFRGERRVGRMLEELRAAGYEVFHDIPGEGFNVDHALIGPGGVFAIETKTWSLPDGKRGNIEYDGERILVDGHKPDRCPVTQAAAVADHLRDLLQRMTDRKVSVRPVVLFPGWYISKQPKQARVWVLNPKALSAFLKNEPAVLSRDDIKLFADRMEVHLSAE
jgi:hypothetical protein